MKERIPDQRGYFGRYGGRFIPETLAVPLAELEENYNRYSRQKGFQAELAALYSGFAGRPTPLTLAAGLSRDLGGAKIYLKREDLTHTGAHKINNTAGQMLLAYKMGKKRIVAETGAGQHGVATAAAAALFGLECAVYMGAADMERQAPNVKRMRLLGAKVIAVHSGSKTLKDAISEAMRDWITNIRTTYYLLGSVLGPHPYPQMVRDFQSVIGREARRQILLAEGKLPTELVACVGGGSNAIGLFYEFIKDRKVAMTGIEAGGEGIASGRHAARFASGSLGVFQGTKTFILQDRDGQMTETHSISAGLDYQAVGPEHALLRETGRARYGSATDKEALAAFHLLCRREGIIPALESAHALAYAFKRAPQLSRKDIIIVNLSGRGDKDLGIIP